MAGKIAILGPGGVGGLLAGALARAGEEVIVVGREQTTEVIGARGLEIRSVRLGHFRVAVDARPELREPVQALIVATKATTLPAALERVASVPGMVLPLLNGLEHMTTLRAHFGEERVAAGTIRVESDRPEPGVVVQTSPFLRVELAAERPALHEGVQNLSARLDRAGIPASVEQSEGQILWSKLVRLCALACTTSAADRPIGFIRSDPEWRSLLVATIEEAARVAAAEGAQIDPAGRLAELDEAHPELGSSMQRDIAAGREPELDAIAGAVVRAGRRHGIECPTIARLSRLIAERAGLDARPASAGGAE